MGGEVRVGGVVGKAGGGAGGVAEGVEVAGRARVDDFVLGRVAADEIAAGAAVDPVGAEAAGEEVVAGAALHEVVADTAVEAIVPFAAAQDVVAALAVDDVVPGTAFEGLAADTEVTAFRAGAVGGRARRDQDVVPAPPSTFATPAATTIRSSHGVPKVVAPTVLGPAAQAGEGEPSATLAAQASIPSASRATSGLYRRNRIPPSCPWNDLGRPKAAQVRCI